MTRALAAAALLTLTAGCASLAPDAPTCPTDAEVADMVQRYAALARPPPAELPRPKLQSSPEQQLEARRALGLSEDARPVVLCPGAEYGPAKRWPIEHFAALARQVGAGGTAVWIVSSAKDKEVGEQIANLSQGTALNLCGRSSLEQAVDLIASAKAVVSNDSGLMHVAASFWHPAS